MPSVGRFRYLDAPPRVPSSRQRPRGSLVLLHAFPLSAQMWEPQLALAEEGWRVVAPDLRGFGDGAADPPTASMDDFAADLIDLLDALHIHDAIVAGLSLGGYVAFALLRIVPGYVKGLILADTRADADSPEAARGRERMRGVVAERGAKAAADELLPKLLGDTTRRDRPETVETVRRLIVANAPSGISGALTAMQHRPDSSPLLPKVHVPTLVVVGEEDSLTPVPLARTLHERIAGSEFAVVPGAGHLSSLEAPEAFNGVLARFLGHRV
jgi:3-oxoadipate enol-lactonase